MLRKSVILLMLLCLVVATAHILRSRNSEPTFNGRSLSGWYEVMIRAQYGDDPRGVEESKQAIEAIGTKAIPYLLKQVRYVHPPTPPWERKVYDLPIVGEWFAMRIRPAEKADQAGEIVFLLGTNVAPAIPELARLINTASNIGFVNNALWALAGIGEPSVPAFAAIISDPGHRHRRRALSPLCGLNQRCIGTNTEALLPHLVQCSRDPNPYIANRSLKAIGRLGLAPDFSVPFLIQAFQQTTNQAMRMSAAEALGNFGARASNAIPVLQLAHGDPSDHIRYFATNALHQIQSQSNDSTALESH